MGPMASGNGSRATKADLERELSSTRTDLAEAAADNRKLVESYDLQVEHFTERLAELELALEDAGWARLAFGDEWEFSRSGLEKIVRMSRLMFLKNPLIRRAILVQSYYVFGQGVEVTGRADVVKDVVNRFWSSRSNRDAFTDHANRTAAEQKLQHDGNIFWAMFPDSTTGDVEVRSVRFEEISEIVCNPADRLERWYYKRSWTQSTLNLETGKRGEEQRTVYVPDWRIFFKGPAGDGKHPAKIGGHEVVDDYAIMHIKVGGLSDMKFGIPDVYAALDWARAYKQFLENWHAIIQSLSRWAWKLSTRPSRIGDAKKKIGTTLSDSSDEDNPPPTTGGVFIQSRDDVDLAPIPKTGATFDADDGRQLRLMVASATDMPDTILSNDPQQGALATAKTLDRPTELAMRDRQMLWADTIRDMISFAIDADLEASGGLLKTRGEGTDRVAVDGADEVDLTVDVTFPPILEQDQGARIDAIVKAATLSGQIPQGTIPDELLRRLLLVALEVENVDELVREMVDDIEPADAEEAARIESSALRLFSELREGVRRLTGSRRVVVSEQGAADAVASGSVMVGYFLEPELAGALAVPEGEAPEDLHITIAFLGTVDGYSAEDLERITDIVGQVADGSAALRGTVSGVGRFRGDEADPFWAAVDVPGLDELRRRIVDALTAEGLEPRNEHGFTPHITLGFVEPGDPIPVETVPEEGFTIDRLEVAVGGRRASYALSSEPVVE